VAQPQAEPPAKLTGDEALDKALQEILGGELPGEGYLEPKPAAQETLVPTNAEKVRDRLLRSIEVCAIAGQLPYSSERKADVAEAALRYAQTYLLLDPKVDAEGVDVEARAEAIAKAAPPRVPPTASQEAFKTKNEGKDTVNRQDRPQSPRPARGAGG
jgi:hypothetical protein